MSRFYNRIGFLIKEAVQTEELSKYTQDMIGVSVDDCVEGETGEVRLSSAEDYAYICLRLKSGSIRSIQERLENIGRTPIGGKAESFGFNGHAFAEQLKSQKIVSRYSFLFSGKGGAMTRSVELYLAEDYDGKEYLYLFG